MPYSEIILSTHSFVKKLELTKPLPHLRNLFTVRSHFEEGKEVSMYEETPELFGIPRYYADVTAHAQKVVDRRTKGTEVSLEMTEGFALRENQVGMFENFCNRLQNGNSGFLVNAPTGYGKTAVAIRMAVELGVTTLVVVPRDFLVQQWVDRILSITKLTRADIGLAQQGVCDFKGKKIVIGMIHSLAKDKYPKEFKEYFGAVFWDEVHVVGAETFAKTVGMFPAYYRVGMSATLDRKDGMSDVFRLAIGQTNLSPVTPGGLNTLVSPKVFLRSYTAKTKHKFLSNMRDAKSRRGVLISELANDLARNALIAVYAKKFTESSRRVLVLSDRIEQLQVVRDILIKRHGFRASAIGLFTGATKDADRKIILQHSQIVLATYGVMSMGIDVPDLRALIFATPLSDAAQSVGRILRLCEGVKEPVLLDILDTRYDDCLRWAKSRQKYYRDVAKAQVYKVEG